MIPESILDHIETYRANDQIADAAYFLLRSYGLESENLKGFEFRKDEQPNYIVLTTEGNFDEPQIIRIPRNLFTFKLEIVVNLMAHEMLHVKQKTAQPNVLDKNEREWQAYHENLFHEVFPQVPEAPLFNQKQFAEKALEYYKRMGEGSELQTKYSKQKENVLRRLDEILIARGEKTPETQNTNEIQNTLEFTPIKPEISWSDFEKLDIRVGTILNASNFEKARNPAYILEIDFGAMGIRKSSAQITALYSLDDLLGKQVLAVVNFPKKQIANILSECLVLGLYGEKKEEVTLITPSIPTKNGMLLG